MTRGKDKVAIDQISKAPIKPSGKEATEASAEEPSAKKPKKQANQNASEAAADGRVGVAGAPLEARAQVSPRARPAPRSALSARMCYSCSS
jgi:hypothetical protein